MASPQKENGYTAIANEILEKIVKLSLNGTQFRIIMMIWRQTYGYSRKEHTISNSFLSKALGVARPNINRELKSLFAKRVLTLVKEATFCNAAVIAFNKDYDEWQEVSNSITGVESVTGIELDTITGIELDTPTGIGLDTQKSNKKTKIKQDARTFFESVWELYPEKKGKGKISEKLMRALQELGYETVELCIKRYVADKPDWQEFQHGSTFFSNGYVDYLDENYFQTTPDIESSVSSGERDDY